MKIILILSLVISSRLYSKDSPEVPLTPEQEKTLEIGKITPIKHAGGGVLAIIPGFGVGHAVQGRLDDDKRFYFTYGEIATSALMVLGATACVAQSLNFLFQTNDDDKSNDTMCTLGVLGAFSFAGLKIWEISDALFAPFFHNKRYKKLKEKHPKHSFKFQGPQLLVGKEKTGVGISWSF